MPGQPLVDIQYVSDWITQADGKVLGAGQQTLLDAAIVWASELVIELTGRLWIKAVVTERHDGDNGLGRYGHIHYLNQWPVDTAAAITVTESGTARTVATTYTTTADVMVYGSTGKIVRIAGSAANTSGWTPGQKNIVVAFTGGDAVDIDGVPYLIRQATAELAVLAYREGGRVGMGSMSRKSSGSYVRKLSDEAARGLLLYAPKGRPTCCA